jgi:histidine ammonia-lyase
MRHASLLDLPVRTAFELAADVLDPDLADRPLSDDIDHAALVLDSLAEV